MTFWLPLALSPFCKAGREGVYYDKYGNDFVIIQNQNCGERGGSVVECRTPE